jgi:hypothetical protein
VLNTVTTFSFFGGAGLVLLAAMLSLLNVASGLRVWIPAVTAAAACLAVGVILMAPERLKPGIDNMVAYAPYIPATEDTPRKDREADLQEDQPGPEAEDGERAAQEVRDADNEVPALPGQGEGPVRQTPSDLTSESGVASQSERLYWAPLLATDDGGVAKIDFVLPNLATTYRLTVAAHAGDGRLGSASATIACLENH